MGLFSSKKKTTVGTSIVRVIEDDSLPNAVLAGSIKALFQNGDSADYVIEELIASIGMRAERMYSYAEKKYSLGLPSGDFFTSNQGKHEVEQIIEYLEGPVAVEYSNFGPANILHMGWMELVNNHGYNSLTNQIGKLSTETKKVYLKDMVVVLPAANDYEQKAFEQWGFPPNSGEMPNRSKVSTIGKHTPVNISSAAVEPYLLVTYAWEDAPAAVPTPPSVGNPLPPSMKEDVFEIHPTGYDPEGEYFQVKYTTGTQTKYWMYKHGAGTYPTLDAIYADKPVEAGTYFPFIYFRHNKKPVTESLSADVVKQMKKMGKYLGMDYDLIVENINKNPDIKDVEQAMLTFAIPPVSQDPIENRYLFDYFDQLSDLINPIANPESLYPDMERIRSLFANEPTKETSYVIKDNLFKMSLSHKGIFKRLVTGTIGPLETYKSEYGVSSVQTTVTDKDTNQSTTYTDTQKKHIYKKQVAPGLIQEIQVIGLKMTYFVFENYTTVGDEEDEILLIPIDKSVTENYSISTRETLYARAMHFVFNSRVVTKVKWYQTGVFKVFMIIVAIVITVYTYGADGGSAIATALGFSGTAGLIATIVVNLAIGALFPYVFKVFVKVFGEDIATVLAIVAVIYGAYQMIDTGSIVGAPWATEMLQVANGLSQAIMESKFLDLMNEANEFNLFVEKQLETLEKAEKLLEGNMHLNPLVIFGESPQDFYNRTVHSGNIGVLSIDAISSYVDIALTLPKLNDTIGAPSYG